MRSPREVACFGVTAKKSIGTGSLLKSSRNNSHFVGSRPAVVSVPSASREPVAIAVCRPPPPHQTFLNVEKLFLFCSVQCFLIFCQCCDLVSAVDSCYREHCVHLRWTLTFWDAVFSRVTIDVCPRQHKRKKKLAEILWESPPGADVLLTALVSRTSLASVSVLLWLLESRRPGSFTCTTTV